MFFNVLYFNEDLYERYTSIMQPGKNVKYTEVQTNAKTGGEVSALGFKADKSNNSTFSGTLNESSNSKILSFEKLVSSNDYYIDFVEGEEHKEFSAISKNMIIKISLPLYIPEEFDNLEIIQDFKDQILNPNLYEIKKGEEQIFDKYMDFKELKIPVYNDSKEKVIFSKLQKNYFEISTEELDDLENEVTILAHVKRHHRKDFEIFNPINDLFSFPRQIRREVSKSKDQKFNPIVFDNKEGFELDIISIYD